MPWDEERWDRALLAFYRDLIALRRASEPLQQGGFQVLATEADTLAYQREGERGRVVVVAHRGARPRPAGPLPVAHGGVPDGTAFRERFSGQEAVVEGGALPLPEHPQGASVWIAEADGAPRSRRRTRAAAPAAAPAPAPAAAARPRADEAPRARSRAPRCPVCGRQDGSRLERHLTRGAPAPARGERWICIWCGAAWGKSG